MLNDADTKANMWEKVLPEFMVAEMLDLVVQRLVREPMSHKKYSQTTGRHYC